MTRSYSYEDGRPGRPKTEIEQDPPKGFSRHLALMNTLDRRGWYRHLAERREYEKVNGDPRDYEDWRLRRVTDPHELDRVLCRAESVAECETAEDLEIARFNGRVVLQIDPACPHDLLLEKIQAVLERARDGKPRRINIEAWAEHRILALYDLKLMGYDLSKERKQLAVWLFPETRDEKARGDKFDRARELLDMALSHLNTLRAVSNT
ncbi:MAG: hypothetical protein ACLPKB_27815 [Xanthobacteraceae bacterium]